MDLLLFFSPIDENIYSEIVQSNSIYKNIKVYGEKMPSYKDAHIAIFGVNEERGTYTNKGCAKGADEIRRKLYQLKKEDQSNKFDGPDECN